jgi:hypothetical protein
MRLSIVLRDDGLIYTVLQLGSYVACRPAHGLGHGPVGAAVSAWPAVALIGSYELLTIIIRIIIRKVEPPASSPELADAPAHRLGLVDSPDVRHREDHRYPARRLVP